MRLAAKLGAVSRRLRAKPLDQIRPTVPRPEQRYSLRLEPATMFAVAPLGERVREAVDFALDVVREA